MTIPGGSADNVKLMVASMHPVVFAEFAKAPARTNIHIIIIMLLVLAPSLKMSILLAKGIPFDMAMPYMPDAMNATVMGTL